MEKQFEVAETIGGWLQNSQFTGTYSECLRYAEAHGLKACDIYQSETFSPDYLWIKAVTRDGVSVERGEYDAYYMVLFYGWIDGSILRLCSEESQAVRV